jgi:hypothetical protein
MVPGVPAGRAVIRELLVMVGRVLVVMPPRRPVVLVVPAGIRGWLVAAAPVVA